MFNFTTDNFFLRQTGKARPAMIALGFVMSFSAVALLLSAITRAFDFDPNLLRTGAAILLAGFGLLMIWPAPFEWLSIRLTGSVGQAAPSPSLFGGFVLGSTLGLVWTPCAGPVLGSILTIVATSKDTAWASLQLVTYDRRRDPDACHCLWRTGRQPPACAAWRGSRRGSSRDLAS